MVLTSSSSSTSYESDRTSTSSPRRLTVSFLLSLSSLMALCAKQANRFSTKLRTRAIKTGQSHHGHRNLEEGYGGDKTPSRIFSPKSPLVKPKQLFTQISNKAIMLVHKKRGGNCVDVVAPDEFGDGGVWQKAILMGDKCQPLDFSGVIYYDSVGKQLDELPNRSPRASPSPGYLTRAD